MGCQNKHMCNNTECECEPKGKHREEKFSKPSVVQIVIEHIVFVIVILFILRFCMD